MKISDDMIIRGTSPNSPLRGFYRVVQVFRSDDEVVLIEIPIRDGISEGTSEDETSRYYYAKGFLIARLSKLEESTLLQETALTWPALWNFPDNEIRKLYPARKGKTDSSVLLARERKMELIRPILPVYELASASGYQKLETAASAHAKAKGVSNRIVLDALHRYYAFGWIENALMLNTTRCGCPGAPRIALKGKKHGRRNAAAAVGNFAMQGKILTEDDRKNLRDGWAMYVRPGTTVRDGFHATTATFYSTGYEMKNGVYVPILLDAHLRPTEREFRFQGPKGTEDAAARRLMGEGEWLKNRRELVGNARSGVVAFGQVGSIDASPIDVNLVACFDRMRPIGVGRGIFVTDGWQGPIVGWHTAIGGIGTDDANMAILNAALGKEDMLQQYGLENLPPEDFPSAFFLKLLSDNGELRAIAGIDASVKKLGGGIEFIRSGRPDQNSQSEAGHHSRHRGLDHHLPGTNRGRQKKRGEKPPITNALLSHYEYCRLLIQWIHWYNTKQQVPHMLTVEMRRDNVKPTRIEIYRWASKNGYVASNRKDQTYLKAHLLPTFKASIRRNGLVLHRPNTGNAVELLRDALFNDPYLASSGLIRAALNGGPKHVDVKADPGDLSRVYLVDAKGVHEIQNVSDDLILVHEGCLADLGAMNDADGQRRIETASERDQADSDMRAFRVEAVATARRKKQAAVSKLDGATAKVDRSSVRENQRLEERAQLDASVRRTANGAGRKSPRQVRNVQEAANPEASAGGSPINISALRRKTLKGFHQKRGASC